MLRSTLGDSGREHARFPKKDHPQRGFKAHVKRILLITSEVSIQRAVMLAGRQLEASVVALTSLRGAERELRTGRLDAALVSLDELGDPTATRALLSQLSGAPALLLATDATMPQAIETLALGFADVARVPAQPAYIAHRVEGILRQAGQQRPSTSGDARVGFIGDSPAMAAVRAKLAKLAQTDLTVAVYGESGTGKELAARTIHLQSGRAPGPLVVANCAAMPETLFENELFGHERGSYTGAARTTGGLVEEAAGGTLVLDEIGELPLPLQSKLLRFLQFGTYRRVGGTKELRSDARVVAVTNRFLPDAVAEKRFRADLFYRVHLLHVVMPPLRERLEDIPALVRHIADAFRRRHNRPAVRFDGEALAALMAYPWPGNVRELEGMVQTTLALHNSEAPVTADDLQMPTWNDAIASMSAQIATSPEHPPPTRLHAVPTPSSAATWRTTSLSEAKQAAMDRFEVGYLHDLLTATRGNVAEAARRAGTDRKTLWRIMRRHGVDAVEFKRKAGTKS